MENRDQCAKCCIISTLAVMFLLSANNVGKERAVGVNAFADIFLV